MLLLGHIALCLNHSPPLSPEHPQKHGEFIRSGYSYYPFPCISPRYAILAYATGLMPFTTIST
jgi:hypothetical protein